MDFLDFVGWFGDLGAVVLVVVVLLGAPPWLLVFAAGLVALARLIKFWL